MTRTVPTVQQGMIGRADPRMCVINYARLLSNPFERPDGDWCSIGGTADKTIKWSYLSRNDVMTDSNGVFWCGFNPYGIASDINMFCGSDGSSVVPNPILLSGANWAFATQSPYKTADYKEAYGGVTSQISKGRIVAAGICVSPIGNANITQGQLYSFMSPGNTPIRSLTFNNVIQNSTSPRATCSLNGCYTSVFVPQRDEDNDWMATTPPASGTAFIPYPFSDCQDDGCTNFIFGNGFQANYPLHIEVACHFEVYDVVKYPFNATQSINDPKSAGIVQQVMSSASKTYVQTTPDVGFFDKFLDGLGSVAKTVGGTLVNSVGPWLAALL